MPRSRRSKLVSLTKTKKKGREWKDDLIERIRHAISSYERILVFRIHNMRTAKFQELRDQLRATTRFLVSAKRVTQVAMGKDETNEYTRNLHRLSHILEGNVGLMCTNLSTPEAVEILENFTTADFARVGEEASENFFLKQGPLEGPYGPFQHTLEPTFRNYGLPTRLNRGAIELLRDCEVCRKGQKLDANQANLLRLFDKKMSHFRLHPIACFDKGGDRMRSRLWFCVTFRMNAVILQSIAKWKRKRLRIDEEQKTKEANSINVLIVRYGIINAIVSAS